MGAQQHPESLDSDVGHYCTYARTDILAQGLPDKAICDIARLAVFTFGFPAVDAGMVVDCRNVGRCRHCGFSHP
jgi:hypothetical protein